MPVVTAAVSCAEVPPRACRRRAARLGGPGGRRSLVNGLARAIAIRTPVDNELRFHAPERRRERVAEKAAAGKPTREIAKEEGVSHTQIIRDLENPRCGTPFQNKQINQARRMPSRPG